MAPIVARLYMKDDADTFILFPLQPGAENRAIHEVEMMCEDLVAIYFQRRDQYAAVELAKRSIKLGIADETNGDVVSIDDAASWALALQIADARETREIDVEVSIDCFTPDLSSAGSSSGMSDSGMGESEASWRDATLYEQNPVAQRPLGQPLWPPLGRELPNAATALAGNPAPDGQDNDEDDAMSLTTVAPQLHQGTHHLNTHFVASVPSMAPTMSARQLADHYEQQLDASERELRAFLVGPGGHGLLGLLAPGLVESGFYSVEDLGRGIEGYENIIARLDVPGFHRPFLRALLMSISGNV